MYTMPPKKADTADTVVYTWPEPSVGTYAAGATYNVLARDVGGRRTTFRVGDVALFEAENSHLPFIGLIEKLWETPDHDMLLSARWFFRPCDCPPTVPMPPDLRENEIFFSNQVLNVLASFWGSCSFRRSLGATPAAWSVFSHVVVVFVGYASLQFGVWSTPCLL